MRKYRVYREQTTYSYVDVEVPDPAYVSEVIAAAEEQSYFNWEVVEIDEQYPRIEELVQEDHASE